MRSLVVTLGAVSCLVFSACGDSAEEAQDEELATSELVAALPAPSGFTASATASGIALSWGAVPRATSYRVFRAAAADGSYVRIATVTATAYLDTAVTAGRTYAYKVAAATAQGRGAYSEALSVTFGPTPSPSPTPQPTPTPTGPGRWQPRPGTSWQWQLTGTLDTSLSVAAYDIDLFDTSTSTIAALRSAGKKVICYFSAGSYENWRPDKGSFPAAALGNALDGWAGERWLDTRSQAVRDVMASRLDLAASKGCDAVEPDNVDGYANGSGFPLTAATQLDYNRFLAGAAHARGLSVALKNDLDQVRDLVSSFDFAIVEECFRYDECNLTSPFLQAGKAVLEAEYGGQSTANTVCPKANAANLDTIVKNLDLDAFRIACR